MRFRRNPRRSDVTVITAAALATTLAHGGPGWGGPGWLFLLIPLFWIAVIALVIGLGGRRWRRAAMAGGHGPWAAPGRAAEGSLAERFAQGEIDESEYTARLGVLRANNAPQPPSKR